MPRGGQNCMYTRCTKPYRYIVNLAPLRVHRSRKYTVLYMAFLAGKSPNIQSYTVYTYIYIYTVSANLSSVPGRPWHRSLSTKCTHLGLTTQPVSGQPAKLLIPITLTFPLMVEELHGTWYQSCAFSYCMCRDRRLLIAL